MVLIYTELIFYNLYCHNSLIKIIMKIQPTQHIQQIKPKQQAFVKANKKLSNHKKLTSVKSAEYLSPLNSKSSADIHQRFVELRKLTSEKDELMKELNHLKEGAVSALLQKQQIIDSLRNDTLLEWHFGDEKEQMQKQISKMNRKINDLTEQKKELLAAKEQSNKFCFEELYAKQILIDKQMQCIMKLENQLEYVMDEKKQLERRLEEEIEKMREIQVQTQTIKIEFLNYKVSVNQDYESYQKHLEIKYNHEIQELILHYEAKINSMQELYERQLNKQSMKSTMETQEYSEGESKDQIVDLTSLKSYYPEFLNLRADMVKSFDNSWKSEDTVSQFTNNFFNYTSSKMRQSTPVKNEQMISYQDEYTIVKSEETKKEQNKSNQTFNKSLIYSGTLGLLAGAFITYQFCKILKI